MSEANQQSRVPSRRRSFMIDPKWQTAVATRMIGACVLVVGLAQIVIIELLSRADTLDEMSSTQWLFAAVLSSSLQLLLVFAVLWRATIRITHSVAGPAMVIERAVDNICAGKFDSRLTLREGDYLKSLAAAVKRLSDQLEQRQQREARAGAVAPQAVCAPESCQP